MKAWQRKRRKLLYLVSNLLAAGRNLNGRLPRGTVCRLQLKQRRQNLRKAFGRIRRLRRVKGNLKNHSLPGMVCRLLKKQRELRKTH